MRKKEIMKVKHLFPVFCVLALCLQSCLGGGKLLSEIEPVYEETFQLDYQGENKSKAQFAIKRAFDEMNYNKIQERGDIMEFEWRSPRFLQITVNKYQRTYVDVRFKNDHATVSIRQNGKYSYGTMNKTRETITKIKELYRSNL